METIAGPPPPQQHQQQSPEPTAHIHSLPDEVLLQIFAYFSAEDIALRVSSVCGRWRCLAEDELLTELAFEEAEYSSQTAVRIIAAAPRLQSLELVGRKDVPQILHSVPGCCGELRRLVVKGWEGQCLASILIDIFRSCPLLADLSLIRVYVRKGLRMCRELGAALPQLRRLNLNCFWFRSTELKGLLGTSLELEELRAVGFSCSDEDAAQLVLRWGGCLQALELAGYILTSAGYAALARCAQLRELAILCPDELTGAEMQMLAALTQLETLDVNATLLPAEDWCGFFSQAPCAERLTALRLTQCTYVDDSVLEAISEACPQLQELALKSCYQFTVLGFSVVLRRCNRLRQIDLRGCSLGVLVSLVENAERASQLRTLVLSARPSQNDARISSDLRTALPRLNIVYMMHGAFVGF